MTEPMTAERANGGAPKIRLRGVRKAFGPKKVLDGVDLEVGTGESVVVIGGSGTGKSVTLKCILGLLTPDSGEGTVLGLDVIRQAGLIKRRVGYMTQKFSLYEDLTVMENLQFLAAIHELPRVQARARIEEMVDRFDFGDRRGQLAGTLSGGQKQRLALAGSILHEPELLLLDEPTSAVDPESRRDFWASLFELADAGTTLLVSTHYMDEAERCHRLAILQRGALVADGTPAALCAALPGKVWKLRIAQTREAEKILRRHPGVLGVAQIGTDLRVLADASLDEAELRAQVPTGAVEIEPVPPNLEDVFVAATRDAAPREAAA